MISVLLQYLKHLEVVNKMICLNSKISIRKYEITFQDNYYYKSKKKIYRVFFKIFRINVITINNLNIKQTKNISNYLSAIKSSWIGKSFNSTYTIFSCIYLFILLLFLSSQCYLFPVYYWVFLTYSRHVDKYFSSKRKKGIIGEKPRNY